jgi:hypothetical protein
MNDKEDWQSKLEYANHPPQVGQTRKDRLGVSFIVVDENDAVGRAGVFVAQYPGATAEMSMDKQAMTLFTDYVSGPTARSVAVIVGHRVAKALMVHGLTHEAPHYRRASDLLNTVENKVGPLITNGSSPVFTTDAFVAILQATNCPTGEGCSTISKEGDLVPGRQFVRTISMSGSTKNTGSIFEELSKAVDAAQSDVRAKRDIASEPWRVALLNPNDSVQMDLVGPAFDAISMVDGNVQINMAKISDMVRATTVEMADSSLPFGRDELAMDFVNAHMKDSTDGQSLAERGYAFADAMIKASKSAASTTSTKGNLTALQEFALSMPSDSHAQSIHSSSDERIATYVLAAHLHSDFVSFCKGKRFATANNVPEKVSAAQTGAR